MTKEHKLQDGINQMKPLTRFVRLTAEAPADAEVPVGIVDAETRTITFTFSSETPVDMWYGTEILSHQSGAARLQRVNSAGPLLFNHDMDDLLGVVERAWIGADKRGYCTVRFGTDERGEWAFQQVQNRILQNVSFMYRVHKFLTDVDGEIYTATDWEVYEISLVTVPADVSVGVGRSVANEAMDVEVQRPQSQPSAAAETNQRNEPMFKKTPVVMDAVTEHGSVGGAAPAAPVVDPQALEAARVSEIEAMCRKHKIADETRDALVQLAAPIEQARGIVLNELLARSKGLASLGSDSSPDLTEKEKAKYSMIRAINAAVNERMGATDAWKGAGFEREVSRDIAKRSGRETAGLFVPTNIAYATRAADYATGTGGGSNLVATNLLSGSFIELLRNKSRVLSLGAQLLSGLVGNVDIPRQTASGSTYWVGEATNLTQTGAAFDKVSLTPKHIGALSVITRNMLQQSTPAIEMLARADLIQTVALGIDLAALSGSGSGAVPKGIVNQSGIGSVVGGTNGLAITIDHLIDMETAVAAANADVDGMAYLANAKTVGALKKLKSTTGQYLWTNSPIGQRSVTPGEINGYGVARSNQARSNLTKGSGTNLSEIFFGNWTDLLIGEWGVIEILPNPYAAGVYEQGGVELRVLQTVDVGVRHAASFAVMSDAITG